MTSTLELKRILSRSAPNSCTQFRHFRSLCSPKVRFNDEGTDTPYPSWDELRSEEKEDDPAILLIVVMGRW